MPEAPGTLWKSTSVASPPRPAQLTCRLIAVLSGRYFRVAMTSVDLLHAFPPGPVLCGCASQICNTMRGAVMLEASDLCQEACQVQHCFFVVSVRLSTQDQDCYIPYHVAAS